MDVSSVLCAGIATVDITPPAGVDLTGGAFGPAKGVLHRLFAKALYLEQGGIRMVLIACDLLGIDEERSTPMRREIARATGVNFDAVMLACTHTHGAPGTLFLRNWGRMDEGYMAELKRKLVAVAVEATKTKRAARTASGSVACTGLTVNRCVGAGGPRDEMLGVMRMDDADGQLMAVVVNYACHPVNLHSAGTFTPDFPYYLERDLVAGLGKTVPVLFLGGASGDILPANFQAQTPSEKNAAETGGKLASAALKLLPTLKSTVPSRLDFAIRHADVALAPLPPADELRKMMAEAQAKLEKLTDRSMTSWDYTGQKTRVEWAQDALRAVDSGRPQTGRTLILQALRIGDTAIVGIPGELFSEFGAAIRQSGIVPKVMVATQANGSAGYFPSKAAFEKKSYEAAHCPRYMGTYFYQTGVGDRVREEAIDLLRQVVPAVRNYASRAIWDRACQVIVGGGQAHKRPTKYMDRGGPAFVTKAKGCRFWDVDGNEYIDYLLSYGPIVLGHADPDVNAAISDQIEKGTIYSLESPLSVELAEELCRTIPSCEMMMYFIGGSSATQGAIRIARAQTGRYKIVRCGYHGWFDWCWPAVAGVPPYEKDMIITLPYDDLPALRRILEENAGQVGGVIIEAFQGEGPSAGYFDGVRKLCDEHGAVFILDEVKTGFRFDMGGAQVPLKIDPDVAVFGKAMCNGYPMSMVVGKRKVMEPRVDTYTGATFHADTLSCVAALTVMRIMRERDGIGHFKRLGQRLIEGVNEVYRKTGLPMKMAGNPAMPAPMETTAGETVNPPMPPAWKGKVMGAFFGAMQRRGIFCTGHVWFLSLAHGESEIEQTLEIAKSAADEAMGQLKQL